MLVFAATFLDGAVDALTLCVDAAPLRRSIWRPWTARTRMHEDLKTAQVGGRASVARRNAGASGASPSGGCVVAN